MLKELLEFLENKEIIILGFGVEGRASYNFLRKFFPNKKLVIADKNQIIKNDGHSEDSNNSSNNQILLDIENNLIELIIGEKYLDNLEDYDIILKTPGLSFKGMNISKFEDKIYTSIDLFLKYYNIVTVGITGTKGKSTTSSLIYEVLKNDGKDVYLLGNIGIPVLEQIENINNDSIVIIELSSHQLQFMKYTTKIAILTNIFPEHLDHYNSYKEYIDCKYRLFENVKNMKELFPDFKQVQIYGAQTDVMLERNYEYDDEAVCIDIDNGAYDDIINKLNLRIKGKHNIQNAIFALMVADILNVDIQKAITSIENFNGLEHRLEYITTYNNVSYYSDSISTIPEATITALNTLKDTTTLIIGGLNRGLDYSILTDYLNTIYDNPEYKLTNILLLPDVGHILEEEIRDEYIKIKVNDVQDAAIKAAEITKEGICLLSPAAASYGFYRDFKERGDSFKETIYELKNKGESHEN